MGAFDFIKRVVYGPQSALPPTRLSQAEALELAKVTAADHWLRDSLTVADVIRNPEGKVVWKVHSAGVGSQLHIVIDDATGAVLERRFHEGR